MKQLDCEQCTLHFQKCKLSKQPFIAERYFNSYSYFHFLRKKRKQKLFPCLFIFFSSPKKFDISNYDRAKQNENLFQEMILAVNSAWALLPHLIAFGLSDEHNK